MINMLDQLNARLRQIEKEKRDLEQRTKELDALSQAILLIINEEKKPNGIQLSMKVVDSHPKIASKVGQTPLGRFAFKVLNESPQPLKVLVELAKTEGINFGTKSPGRVLHRTFVGLKGTGYAETVGRGIWKLTQAGLDAKLSLPAEPVNTGVPITLVESSE